MIEIKYEELVEDFEVNVRRLLAHCGLDWDARCLSFHQTVRHVSTASAAQVRRPLYKTSVRRWQPQPALLQPLLDGLGPELAPADVLGARQQAPLAEANGANAAGTTSTADRSDTAATGTERKA